MAIKYILETEQNLQSRNKSIKDILKSVVANKHMHAKRVPATNNKIIFCFTENTIANVGQFISGNIQETFKTINPNFKASYFEIWDRKDKSYFYLNKIYFHIYSVEERENKEYILLHTDPCDSDLKHGDYKRSPHLHIKKTTEDKISHAHFALNINDFETALSCVSEMDKCFKNHIDMLVSQILS